MTGTMRVALVLAAAAQAYAQGFGGSSGGNPFSSGSGSSSSGSSNNPFSNGFESFFSHYATIITAHAVLATLAFGLVFPVGGILIRIASFPGLWWVHGLIQAIAYILYIAAFALGVYMAAHLHMLNQAHAIIGIVLFVVLFFQSFLGILHHVMFKKHSRRMIWSYGHIWLGRIIITIGIINGGLGLWLAQKTHIYAPPRRAIIGYSVAAGVIWLIYMACAIIGEARRKRSSPKRELMESPQQYTGRRYQYA